MSAPLSVGEDFFVGPAFQGYDHPDLLMWYDGPVHFIRESGWGRLHCVLVEDETPEGGWVYHAVVIPRYVEDALREGRLSFRGVQLAAPEWFLIHLELDGRVKAIEFCVGIIPDDYLIGSGYGMRDREKLPDVLEEDRQGVSQVEASPQG